MCVCVCLFWLCCMACGIFVPQPGTEPGCLTVKEQSPSHWAAAGFSVLSILISQVAFYNQPQNAFFFFFKKNMVFFYTILDYVKF